MKLSFAKLLILFLGLNFWGWLSLAIQAQPKVDSQFRRALQNDPSVTSLEITGLADNEDEESKAYAEAFIQMLATNNQLRELMLEYSNLSKILSPLITTLTKNRTLESLVLRGGQYLRGEERLQLIRALLQHPTLRGLDWSQGGLDNTAIQVMAQELATNSSLTHLDLRLNRSDQVSYISCEGIKALLTALIHNTTLTYLDLGINRLGDAEIALIADFLRNNSSRSLTGLGLGGERFTTAGLRQLTTALAVNTTLTRLDFSSNQLGDTGAELLASMLINNITLTELDLGYNQFSSRGAVSLAQALAKRPTELVTLNLSGNPIGDEGALALAAVLREQTSLTSLTLTNCKLSDRGTIAIIEALMNHPQLTRLHLNNDQPTDATLVRLSELLQANPRIVELHVGGEYTTSQGVRVLMQAMGSHPSLDWGSLSLGYNRDEVLIDSMVEFLQTNQRLRDLGSMSINFEIKGRWAPGLETRLLKGYYANHHLRYVSGISWSSSAYHRIHRMICKRNCLIARIAAQTSPERIAELRTRLDRLNLELDLVINQLPEIEEIDEDEEETGEQENPVVTSEALETTSTALVISQPTSPVSLNPSEHILEVLRNTIAVVTEIKEEITKQPPTDDDSSFEFDWGSWF